ncbi:MAG: glycosyltransferase family 87 protein, partial [Candidatus Aminicenantes bacterium]
MFITKMSVRARKILLIILVFLAFFLIYQFFVKKDMTDFGVCYTAGKRIVKGEMLYQISDGHLQFKYFPASAAIFSVLTLFPFEMAKMLWYFLELTLLFLCLTISYDLLPEKHKKRGFVVALTFLVLLKFIGREMELGQINVLMAFLLIMMVKALVERKDKQAGFLWGFSLIFKPYALVFLPYFILKKKIKAVASGLGILMASFVLPVFFYGFGQSFFVLKEWQRTLSLSTPSLLDHYDNSSVFAFFLKNLPADKNEWAWILSLCTALLLGFCLLWIMESGKKKRVIQPVVLESSFLFIMIPFFSPLSWYYNYLYAILAVVFLINLMGKFPSVMK